MDKLQFSNFVDVDLDLNKSLVRKNLGEVMASGDVDANRFGVRVKRNGVPVDLTGVTVYGYAILPNEETHKIKGSASGNEAFVDIKQECYLYDGAITVTIKILGDGFETALAIFDVINTRTETGTIVSENRVIYDVDTILTIIDRMEQAEKNAEAAAEAANAAAETAAQTVADGLQQFADVINRKAPAIVDSMEGMVCTTDVASDMPLHGLTIYGKTTQDGTPTPENPVPLVNVGENLKENKIRLVCGENLFDIDNPTIADTIIQTDGTFADNVNFDCWRIPVPSRKDNITISFEKGTDFSAFRYGIELDGIITRRTTSTVNVVTISNADAIWITVDVKQIYQTNIMVNLGSAALPYEPYKDGGSITLNTPNGLNGIPVSSGGNYTDANGRQWICDEIDLERGVYVQRIGDTNNNAAIGNIYCSVTGMFAYFALTPVAKEVPSSETADILCSVATKNDTNKIDAGRVDVGIGINTNDRNCHIRISGLTSVDEYKAIIRSEDFRIQYILETPIETPLSAPELAAYAALHTNKPNTTVYNDAGAGQRVDYVADTKSYIDQKIAAIAAATLQK